MRQVGINCTIVRPDRNTQPKQRQSTNEIHCTAVTGKQKSNFFRMLVKCSFRLNITTTVPSVDGSEWQMLVPFKPHYHTVTCWWEVMVHYDMVLEMWKPGFMLVGKHRRVGWEPDGKCDSPFRMNFKLGLVQKPCLLMHCYADFLKCTPGSTSWFDIFPAVIYSRRIGIQHNVVHLLDYFLVWWFQHCALQSPPWVCPVERIGRHLDKY